MEAPDIEIVRRALAMIDGAISARQHGAAAVPYFAPTDIGMLPPSMQEVELQTAEEVAYGNRVRAAIQMSLAASAASLRVCEDLMGDGSQVSYVDRLKALHATAMASEAAGALTGQATAILAGRVVPKQDPKTEIRKLSAAIFQRFNGQPPGGKL